MSNPEKTMRIVEQGYINALTKILKVLMSKDERRKRRKETVKGKQEELLKNG